MAGIALAAVPGVWSGGKPVSFAYQWQRCDAAGANCKPIAGAIADIDKSVFRDAHCVHRRLEVLGARLARIEQAIFRIGANLIARAAKMGIDDLNEPDSARTICELHEQSRELAP